MIADNIVYYKCDVSKWEEVEEVAKKVIEEVSRLHDLNPLSNDAVTGRSSDGHRQQCWRCSRKAYFGSNT